ncbi:hypothetical protein M5689_017234 [Euphorbia peplus]|nr:hypothetical protein M5689_017234 [Euphorbia peplus]
MADSEKLTALKKAYADIILNTAKEAAARIMVSESKAQRYQRELFAAKDESLRMLLRLKQMFDSKVNEAEISSLSQTRRIEELEAQLGEAEDIVKDLRAELREAQDELERVSSRQKQQPLEGQNATEDIRTSCTGSVISSLPSSQCDPIITLETNNSNLNGACDGNKCHSDNVSCKENCFACTPDFASIVIRSKEPELYRNGCTQRIRAFERNLLGGTLSDGVKNQVYIGDKENKEACAKADSFCDLEKIPDLVKDIEADNRTRKRRKINQCVSTAHGAGMKNQNEVVKHKSKNFATKPHITSDAKRNQVTIKNGGGIPRRIRTKRAAKYWRDRKYKDLPVFPLQAVDNNAQTQEDCRTNDNVLHKDPEPVVALESPPNAVKAQSEGTKIEEEFSFQNAPSSEKLELTEQDAVSGLSPKFPACKTGYEASCLSLPNSSSQEPNATSPVQPADNKFLKFTFQRKRKKEFPNSPDGDSSLTRKVEGEVNGSLELQKSSQIPESSRDNRRLAQVARQLISLSEKKWRSVSDYRKLKEAWIGRYSLLTSLMNLSSVSFVLDSSMEEDGWGRRGSSSGNLNCLGLLWTGGG